VIGDVHGRYDLLRQLMRQIEQHSRSRKDAEKLHVLLLGDIVDRGPESAQALHYLHDWTKQARGQHMLLGNHEDMMLRTYRGDARTFRAWMRVGGRETLASFGLHIGRDDDLYDPRILRAVRDSLPHDLMTFIGTWPLTARSGDYFFCHAGVKPRVPLDRQSKQDLIWIRDEFLADESDHGAVIVHGHSISPSIDRQHNRIGIDTGAYHTGILTAAYFEDDQTDFIATEQVSAS
jgi:serine/threonine protein phosphatase 1